MSEKKVKTCKKCGKTYTGRYCKNRGCVNYHQGKAKARASASRRRVSRMHFGKLSAPVAPASSPVAGQGGSQISANPSAVPVPTDTVIIPEETSWTDWVELQSQRVLEAEYALTHLPPSSDPVNQKWISDCNEHNKRAFEHRRGMGA